jgi:hypothetical protein
MTGTVTMGTTRTNAGAVKLQAAVPAVRPVTVTVTATATSAQTAAAAEAAVQLLASRRKRLSPSFSARPASLTSYAICGSEH